MGFCTKLCALVLGVPFLLLALLLFRAEVYFPRSRHPGQCNQTHTPIGGQAIVDRFAAALRIPTITRAEHDYDGETRIEFANFLRKNFPTIYTSPLVRVESVNNYSLLYTVKGSDRSLKPYLLCSHMDVVPVELDKWTVDPFGGIVKDGFIYGRGTIDIKNTLMAIMEALEYALKSGFTPKRSFYLAFGHDEEAKGTDGAQEIAKTLKARGVKEFEFLLDEGMVMFKDSFPGIKEMIAIVAVAEKGYLSLKVTAKGQVGHSSMAPRETAITKLARAVSKLTSDAHQNLFGLGPERHMMESFAYHADYPYKLVYSNLWLFSPLISRLLSNKPSTNGFVRTTSAVTVIKGGFKDNVLPSLAEATVNHRVHPQQSIQDVFDADRAIIDDPTIDLEILGDPTEPHPISPYGGDSFGYQTVTRSIGQVFPNTIAIPGVFVASTDTKWYLNFTQSVYRFSPSIMVTEEDTRRFHGHDERISVDNYLKTVNFFHHILLNSDRSVLEAPKVHDEL